MQFHKKKFLFEYSIVHFEIVYFRASQNILSNIITMYWLAISLTPPWKQFFPLCVAPDELNQDPSHLFFFFITFTVCLVGVC